MYTKKIKKSCRVALGAHAMYLHRIFLVSGLIQWISECSGYQNAVDPDKTICTRKRKMVKIV